MKHKIVAVMLILMMIPAGQAWGYQNGKQEVLVNGEKEEQFEKKDAEADVYREIQEDMEKAEEILQEISEGEDEDYDIEKLREILRGIKRDIDYLRWRREGDVLKNRLHSSSFIVLDVTGEQIVLERNSTQRYSIASITKLMSSLVVAQEKKLEEEVVLRSEMLSTAYNKTPALFPSLSISIENLLTASLTRSINDAAETLNYVVDGDLIDLMNSKAREITMHQTSFVDAHGISRKNISSAVDITKLLYYISIKHPEILEITSKDGFWLVDQSNNRVNFTNLNLFHGFSGFVGGKTGYATTARQTFAGMFEVKDRDYIIVFLHSENRREDTKEVIDWLEKRP